MARNWEAVLTTWAKPPSESEQERCDRAVRMVKKAIDKSDKLALRNIYTRAQGSWRNRVNVRKESDVDLYVLCTDTFFYQLPPGVTTEQIPIYPASFTYTDFKDQVDEALVSHFGRQAVHRGNKAFDIHENTYHVDADVVAVFEHRCYFRHEDGSFWYYSGTQLIPDNGGLIINWPEQHYDRGVAKNKATSQHFKPLVRILKRVRNEMADIGVVQAAPIPGFLAECLVSNVPNSLMLNERYADDLREALVWLYHALENPTEAKKLLEVSQMKYLIHPTQKWTREEAPAFVLATWGYVGFQ